MNGMRKKFHVIKVDDANRYLMASDRPVFNSLLDRIAYGREEDGKGENVYIVINTDEPYASEVVDILKENGHWGEGDPDVQPVKSISNLVKEAHENAINKGWYEEPRTFGEVIALVHSELSEALEDYRSGRGLREIYFEGDKPCGIPTELADVVIRIFDTCGHLSIDLETAIKIKMEYNATRPQRHGGKKL